MFDSFNEQEKLLAMKAQYALTHNEYEVYFQPKLNLRKKEIESCEALIRWNSPEFGFLSPISFLYVFEKTGFIQKLDLFVLEQCCKKFVAYVNSGIKPCCFAVNQSRVDFENPNYVLDVCRITDRYGVPRNFIELEFSEKIFLENNPMVLEIIKQFKQKGFVIVMDDFENGYKSIYTFNDLCVDILKIDKSFLDDVETSNETKMLVKSIVSMAKSLNIKAVCEGVETEGQIEFLKSIDCDGIQGYFFYKPVPTKLFDDIFRNRNKK